MMRILILAALPQEHGPYRRLSRGWRLISRRPLLEYARRDAAGELRLVETGMGGTGLGDALAHWRNAPPPDAVISMGFCGSMESTFPVGQVILGTSFQRADPSREPSLSPALRLRPPAEFEHFCSLYGVRPARVITLDRPAAKGLLKSLSPGPGLVADMESFHIGRFAMELDRPFLCLRSVSDASVHEIDFDLGDLTDSRGRVRIARVLRSVGKRPAVVGPFLQSWRRSRTAGRSLGRVLGALLDGSPSSLHGMIEGCRLSLS
ncbi:MAG TPA: hypothetical protein PLM79_08680 [Syntrophobacteraceae bacterium]|nr:hypothetical protein [Syntrophobacteraceae bacterium]